MSSAPDGKRSWKCPECGAEVLLSITQLDPMACDACLPKMKKAGKSSAGPIVADAVAGPLSLWQRLPETTKLGAVVVALVVGLVAGYLAGKASVHPSTPAIGERRHANESVPAEERTTSHEAASEDHADVRPDPPGPGYKWVPGRKHKDGTRGEGHWTKK
jgi:hypothetical protein